MGFFLIPVAILEHPWHGFATEALRGACEYQLIGKREELRTILTMPTRFIAPIPLTRREHVLGKFWGARCLHSSFPTNVRLARRLALPSALEICFKTSRIPATCALMPRFVASHTCSAYLNHVSFASGLTMTTVSVPTPFADWLCNGSWTAELRISLSITVRVIQNCLAFSATSTLHWYET
jgi:hypothetical protein